MKEDQLRTKTAKKAMLEALVATNGHVCLACQRASVARSAHYRWLEEDPEYKDAVEEVGELRIDLYEQRLDQLMQGGDTTAVIFFLKTKARKRGYVERNEISLSDTFTITFGGSGADKA